MAGACDKGLTDINRNPNGPTEVSAEFLFPQGAVASVATARGANFDMTFTSLFAQHLAKIQYTEEDRYDIRPESNDGWWQAFYAVALQDLHQAAKDAGQRQRPNLLAPALTMRSWTFGAMTDVWGDIPYSEANQGMEAGATITPKYDRQPDIYNGILAELKSASDMIVPGAASYGSADPIYAGDAAKWKKFANSLRLRYAMRMSKADPAKAQAEVQAALQAGVFTSNADNARLVWPGDAINDHPIFQNFKTRDDHRVSRTMVNMLQSLNDPRLAVYARPAENTGQFLGVPNGLTSPDANALGLANTSRIGVFYSSRNSASMLMDYAEVLFIQAEAAARGWISGNAADLYRQAITASLQANGISAAAIATYLAQPAVQYNGLASIHQQQWIAFYTQGIEAWSLWRRTGVPNLQPGPAAFVNQVPRRLPYPSSEQTFNNANREAAIAAQGGAGYVNRVWWDK
ncbi:SusD/RagB family nutrient-binding outer membrane lipoprotein [soil metagenome]|jgi:hypothetical protein